MLDGFCRDRNQEKKSASLSSVFPVIFLSSKVCSVANACLSFSFGVLGQAMSKMTLSTKLRTSASADSVHAFYHSPGVLPLAETFCVLAADWSPAT